MHLNNLNTCPRDKNSRTALTRLSKQNKSNPPIHSSKLFLFFLLSLIFTIAFQISLKIRRPTKQTRSRQWQRVMRLILVGMRRQSHQHLRFCHRSDLQTLARRARAHFSPMSAFVVVVGLLAAVISLAHCRIISGSIFPFSSKVDVTCHGDTVEFDGNLRIRQHSSGRVIFNVGTPVDSTAILAFQTDGAASLSVSPTAEKIGLFFCRSECRQHGDHKSARCRLECRFQ
jgi:hypothetical protein